MTSRPTQRVGSFGRISVSWRPAASVPGAGYTTARAVGPTAPAATVAAGAARPARLQGVRVRQFELRLLAVALTVLWAAGGGVVLLAYRPGGPVDLLVGIAASLPLLVAVAAIVWPPLVRSDRGSAGVFWLGLAAGLLLLPSIAAVGAQVLQGGSQPLLPSLEVVYPWALALLATSLFAGLGISRQLITEVGIGRRRLAGSIAFALAATTIIGGIFAGVSLADDSALRNKAAAHSRFGPTDPNLTPPECNRTLVTAKTGHLDFDLSANVDTRAVGTVSLTGSRSGSDVSWRAQVVRSDLFGQYGAVRIGNSAWTESPGHAGASDPARSTRRCSTSPSWPARCRRRTAPPPRTAAWNTWRARGPGDCRVAVDGPTFLAVVPAGGLAHRLRDLDTWRGEIDFWVFGDGEVGMVTGTINGNARGDPRPRAACHRSGSTLTATDRDAPVSISPPGPDRAAMTPRAGSRPTLAKRDRLARFYRVLRYLAGPSRGRHGGRDRRLRGHVAPDRLPRPAGPRGRDRHPAVERGRPLGDRRGRLPAAAAPDPGRGRGLLPGRAPDRPVRRPLRPGHRRRLPEAGRDPAAGGGPPPGADDRRPGQPPARTSG